MMIKDLIRISRQAAAVLMSALCALAFWSLSAALSEAEAYRLGAEDTVALRVVVWSDETAAYETMEALSGQYSVEPDGTLSVPIAGTIAAGGATPSEAAAEIAARLQAATGLYQPPEVSVQILRYRPFYIAGDAAVPGAYDWRPGMTASKALALAGGLYRSRVQTRGEEAEYRVISSLRSTQVELVRLRARELRLLAEQAGEDAITFPDNLRHPDGPEAVARIYREETDIFAIRRESLARTVESNEALIALYETELEGLNNKLPRHLRQVELAREQVENLRRLVDRGAVVASRLVDAERILTNLSAEELDLNTEIFRARQRIGETHRDLLQGVDNRRYEIVAQLQETRRKIELETKREAMFLGLASVQGATPADLPLRTVMTIRRDTVEGVKVMSVGPDDPVLPGDVFDVALEFLLTTQ